MVSPDERRAADRDDDDASKPAEKDDGLRIAWQYRRYLQQGKSLDDSRVGRGGGALAAGVSVTGASASASSGSATKNTGGVRRLPEMCHQFDLTREMDPAHADAADLRCVPFERAPELVPRALTARVRTSAATTTRVPSRFESATRWRGGAATPIAPRSTRPSAASPSNPRWDSIRSPPRLPSRVFSAPFADDSAGRARVRDGRRPARVDAPASANLLRHWADAAVDVETLPQESHLDQLLPDPTLCVGLLRCRKIQFPCVIGASPLTRMDRTYALQLRRRKIAVRPLRVAPEDEPPAGRSGREKKSGEGEGKGGETSGEKASAGGCAGAVLRARRTRSIFSRRVLAAARRVYTYAREYNRYLSSARASRSSPRLSISTLRVLARPTHPGSSPRVRGDGGAQSSHRRLHRGPSLGERRPIPRAAVASPRVTTRANESHPEHRLE